MSTKDSVCFWDKASTWSELASDPDPAAVAKYLDRRCAPPRSALPKTAGETHSLCCLKSSNPKHQTRFESLQMKQVHQAQTTGRQLFINRNWQGRSWGYRSVVHIYVCTPWFKPHCSRNDRERGELNNTATGPRPLPHMSAWGVCEARLREREKGQKAKGKENRGKAASTDTQRFHTQAPSSAHVL